MKCSLTCFHPETSQRFALGVWRMVGVKDFAENERCLGLYQGTEAQQLGNSILSLCCMPLSTRWGLLGLEGRSTGQFSQFKSQLLNWLVGSVLSRASVS